MTSGPKAKIGDALDLYFERLRTHKSVLEHDSYYKYRKPLIDFLSIKNRSKYEFCHNLRMLSTLYLQQ